MVKKIVHHHAGNNFKADLHHQHAPLHQQEMQHIAAFLDSFSKILIDPHVLEAQRKDVYGSVKLKMLGLTVTDEALPEAETNVLT